MYKRSILMLSALTILAAGSASYSAVIGDWEDGLDGWTVSTQVEGTTATESTIGATRGSKSLKVVVPEGGYHHSIIYNIPGNGMEEVFFANREISCDVTRLVADWEGTPDNGQVGIHMVINAGGDGWTYWDGAYAGWWKYDQGDQTQSITWDYSAALDVIEQDNLWWLEIFFITNYDEEYISGGVFYVDNLQIVESNVADMPTPRDGAVDVRRNPHLTWKPGIGAVSHDFYIGTDLDAVTNVTKDDLASYPDVTYQNTDPNSLDLDDLELGTTYYWRVDEVDSAGTVYPGAVWSFTVGDFIVIDDFEDYNDYSPDTVWEAWIDGWSDPQNGSTAGYPTPDFTAGENYVETNVVHGDNQSMPFLYNNNMMYSEATLTLAGAKRDWTQENVERLSIWYIGHPTSQGGVTEAPVGTYTMTGAGSDVWGRADEFHYAYQMLNGAGSIVAKVSAITTIDPNASLNQWAKAGIMVRETLDANSVHAFMATTPAQGVAFQYRATAGEDSFTATQLSAISERPQWIKLERDFSGSFSAYHANDVGGSPAAWQLVDTQNIQMPLDVYIGLALTSHTAYEPVQAVFSDITTTGTITGTRFDSKDIGILSNLPEDMYVSIANTGGTPVAIPNPDPDASLITEWTEWTIPLTDFAGIDLTDVDQISLGFGDKDNIQAGGDGLVFFDDIRLYRRSCVLDLRSPEFAAADYAPLGAPDCVVDYQELEIMAADWLLQDVTLDDQNRAMDPAAYFPLNTGSGTVAVDASGNGHDATIIGDDVQWIASQAVFDQALDFPGAGPNYVEVGTWNPSEETGQLSIAVWANWAGYSGGWQGLLGKRDSWDNAGSDMMWHLEIGRDSNEVSFARGGSYPGGNHLMQVGEWTHIAVTFDGQTATTYINGVDNGGGAFSFGPKTDATLVIGAVQGDGGNAFNGILDEVYIFDRGISAAEVAHLAALAPGELLVPFSSAADISSDEPLGQKAVNFKDFAVLAQFWLEEQLF